VETPEPVDSLADFVTATLQIRDRWWQKDKEDERRRRKDKKAKESAGDTPPSEFWFRGHAEAGWELKPRPYRADSGLNLEDEDEIRNDFKRRGRQLLAEPFLPANDKEWYFLMQHYGAPTRLLDWTDGSLLGLYFALRSQRPDRPADAAVWMLDPDWLNDVTLAKVYGEDQSGVGGVLLPEWKETDAWFPVPFDQPLLVAEPVALDPPHLARRVAVQHSHFTVHGKTPGGLEEFAHEEESRLLKIVIPSGKVQAMLEDLASCGITETTVYPDLEALSRELSRKWRRRPR